MSKNLKRSLAFGSTLALAAAGMVGFSAPSFAAAGDVTIAPNSGTSYSVFNTDEFVLKTSVITASVSAANLSYKITDADQGKWYVKLGANATFTGTIDTSGVTLSGLTPLGAAGDMEVGGGADATVTLNIIDDGTTNGYGTAGDANEHYGDFVIDMGALGISEFTISGLGVTALQPGASNLITISPYDGALATSTGTAILSPAAGNAPEGNPDEADFGDGAYTATVQAWIETDGNNSTVDAGYASAAQTITWVDPKSTAVIPTAERFVDRSGTVRLNDTTANAGLYAKIQFVPAVNTDQIDIAKWEYKIEESDGTVVGAAHDFVTGDAVGRDGDKTTRSGPDLYVKLDAADSNLTLDVTKDYVISVANKDASAVWYAGAAYVPAANAGVVDQIEASVSTAAGNHLQTDADDLSVQLRAGSKAFTYTAQTKTADAVDADVPSIQVLAVVTTGAYMSTGGSITVSGATSSLTKAGTALIVNGFTDSDGQWDVTVTSSAVAAESYTIEFFVLNGATDAWSNIKTAAGGGTNATYVATYENGTATTLTPDSSVLSGTSVTAGFTVTDQFGVGTNLRGTKAVSVEFKSANGTSVDKDAVVAADGTVSFTFDNYVTAGSADVITATTYTGAVGSAGIGGALTKTVSLYNAAAISAVQVPATLATNVTYGDFLADGAKATAALPAPASGDALLLTGTVVDANGAGVPAGSVTIAAEGFQFQQVGSTKYYQDEITVSASAAGVYNVNMWTHVASSTGVKVTSTSSDGKTASTLVKSYLPTGLNGNNLNFKLNMPANVVKNVTYAVTAELTDKWGNPVQTIARVSGGDTFNGVSFQGVGSVQINSVDTAVAKNFGKDGKTTVFVRSVKDIAGPGSVSAALGAASYYSTSAANPTTLTISEIATDVATTVWDETAFANSVEAEVEVLETAPAPAASADAIVNAGSFNGYVAVYAKGYKGQTLSWKIAGQWFKTTITQDYQVFQRTTAAVGVDVTVELYINGQRPAALVKQVLTR